MCSTLTDIESHDSGENFERMDDMMRNGASYPLDLESAGRHGLFERDAIFMVYEQEDVLRPRDLFIRLAGGKPNE